MGTKLGIALTIIGGIIAFPLLFGLIIVLILVNSDSGYFIDETLFPIYFVEILIMIVGFVLFIYGLITLKKK